MENVFEIISRKQADYARCIDNGEFERWPDFFHESCLYKITTADNLREGLDAGIVYADSRGMLTDRISALREANIYERHTYRHILGQPSILEEDAENIRSETSFLVVRIMREGDSAVFASGRYMDRYQRREGVLKLAERIVVCDSRAIDTLLALPL